MSDIVLHEATLDGKKIAYSSETTFIVQIGKGEKGAYKRQYVFRGNLPHAVLAYNAINLGRGYKKRLLMPSSKKPVLAREASYIASSRVCGYCL